jgi:hypothetical protein
LQVHAIDVPTIFKDFDDYWTPFFWAVRRQHRVTACRFPKIAVQSYATAFVQAW